MWQKMQDLGLRCDRFLESLVEIVLRGRHGELDTRDLDLVAPHALVPRGQHAWVVLLGRDDLVTRFHVDPILGDLHGLAGVACQRELRDVTAELGGHPPAHGADVATDHAVVLHGQHVRHVHVALHRFVHHARTRTRVAVVQIGQRAIEREGFLNFSPVELVLRDFIGGAIGHHRGRGRNLLDAVEGLRNQAGRPEGTHSKKISSVPHVRPPQIRSGWDRASTPRTENLATVEAPARRRWMLTEMG